LGPPEPAVDYRAVTPVLIPPTIAVGSALTNAFDSSVKEHHDVDLRSDAIKTIQVNVGFKCNQTCVHCHLQCGPTREEQMEWSTMVALIQAADSVRPDLVDVTGGAPEIHPHFRDFVEGLRESGHAVQVRTNLTAMLEPGLEDIPAFLRDHEVRLVASMPCYLEQNVCEQRGAGTYERSIEVLRRLNALGYGIEPQLSLDLVYNPNGPFLPPAQAQLEADYKRQLLNRFGLRFTRLLTITNMPIGRFWKSLKEVGKADDYMRLLVAGFNPHTVEGLMCRSQISVAWDGTIYDCDFNLALELPVRSETTRRIEDFMPTSLDGRRIVTGMHCFGCTAGAGSSCGGALASGASQALGKCIVTNR
jgi:radical SAM/Cys-rich protein